MFHVLQPQGPQRRILHRCRVDFLLRHVLQSLRNVGQVEEVGIDVVPPPVLHLAGDGHGGQPVPIVGVRDVGRSERLEEVRPAHLRPQLPQLVLEGRHGDQIREGHLPLEQVVPQGPGVGRQELSLGASEQLVRDHLL